MSSPARHASLWLVTAAAAVGSAGDVGDSLWRLHVVGWFGTSAGTALVGAGRTADLPTTLSGPLGGFDQAILLPFGAERWRQDAWEPGVLAVAAPERTLLALAAPLEIIARQAAVSLHRIALGQESSGRDGEKVAT